MTKNLSNHVLSFVSFASLPMDSPPSHRFDFSKDLFMTSNILLRILDDPAKWTYLRTKPSWNHQTTTVPGCPIEGRQVYLRARLLNLLDLVSPSSCYSSCDLRPKSPNLSNLKLPNVLSYKKVHVVVQYPVYITWLLYMTLV